MLDASALLMHHISVEKVTCRLSCAKPWSQNTRRGTPISLASRKKDLARKFFS
jgi:hypothetical protein